MNRKVCKYRDFRGVFVCICVSGSISNHSLVLKENIDKNTILIWNTWVDQFFERLT